MVRGPTGEGAATVLDKVGDVLRYSFDQKCRFVAIKTAREAGFKNAILSINFMPRAVYEPELCIKSTLDAVSQFGFPIEQLMFEVSELEKADDHKHIAYIFKAYKKMGFRTAIDDFGAGNSGLSLLADFVPDVIKLDRVLVDGISESKVKRIIVKNLLQLSADLGVEVIAEGIEAFTDLEFLRSEGVRYIQGFLLGRPTFEKLVPADWSCFY